MTASLLSSTSEMQVSANPLLSHYLLNQKLLSTKPSRANLPKKEEVQLSQDVAASAVWGALLEALPQGVMVLTADLKLVYANEKANRLCQQLAARDRRPTQSPLVISEICHRLLKTKSLEGRPLLMECQTLRQQTIRLRASWLNVNPGMGGINQSAPHILVTLENCSEALEEEIRIEQRKYDLTEREAEIWMLLRQEYSYQDIAETLQISLNTVKTHVKNVYAKKRSSQGHDRIVLS
jgi:DNA-binding CsgD family transcriptional regulator